MHVVSQRDSGFLNPVCGAHPIRSRRISEWDGVPADLSALCADCASVAAGIRGVETVEQGLDMFLGGSQAAPSVRLLEVAPATIQTECPLREAGDDLIASVATNGVVAPLVARRTTTGLLLVSGGRRLAAAQAVGLATVPVLVRDIDEQQAVIDGLLENLHRQDLNPIAQARAYVDALGMLEVTKEALADGLGVSRSALSHTVRLLALPDHLKDHIAAGRITAAHGRALLRLNSQPEAQDALADEILAGLSTRNAELAARRSAAPAAAPLLPDVAQLLAALLEAEVRVRAKGDSTEITIVVAHDDRSRVLELLGVAA
ncbi:ParB/RepB/Spo0J family partition protein [Amnibacterium kyonggiense]|uniref:ParB/RepB/Spo0J family partition protein n=2 Tax=Amnibacterium kyonggiense TaxID=595671 RepID=A0A4R7FP64_9MICO|nr:ParB/RepB/Spo0J family partition protein [Amnibacterium kyonggiense]